MKHDYKARQTWGKLYDSLPKSTWAILAYHLAWVTAGDEPDNDGAVEARLAEEVLALVGAGWLDARHARTIEKHLAEEVTA